MSWSYDDTPTALQYFAALVQSDEHLPLMEAAISIAQDAVPDLDLQAASAELDRLQVRLVQRLAGETDPLQCLRGLNQFFYGELGFGGNLNDYYDPANSYIHHVLQTRRGIPISVALIWLELAAAIDLPAQGVSFPGHFLVKMRLPQGQVVMDPLSGESFRPTAWPSGWSPLAERGPVGRRGRSAGHVPAGRLAARRSGAHAAQPAGNPPCPARLAAAGGRAQPAGRAAADMPRSCGTGGWPMRNGGDRACA